MSMSCPRPHHVHVRIRISIHIRVEFEFEFVSMSASASSSCPCPHSPSHVRVVLKWRGDATGKGMSIVRCMRMREDAGEGTAMDPHAGMVRWRGEGGHGEGEGVGGENKVGGMGTAMHVG